MAMLRDVMGAPAAVKPLVAPGAWEGKPSVDRRLTIKIRELLTVNVPYSFAFDAESGYKVGMNEILFIVGDVPVHTGHALIAFGALALLLLLTIAVVIARSGRKGAEAAMA
jgi:DNA recombination protein RmuC